MNSGIINSNDKNILFTNFRLFVNKFRTYKAFVTIFT